jgi:hypothetical protein
MSTSGGTSVSRWLRWAAAGGLILLTAVLVTVLAQAGTQPAVPRLVVHESVAPDFAALAEEAWERFLLAFPARTGCFGDAHLVAVRQLESRAAYDPATATVTVPVPATAAMLQSALVHEWAHHVEFQCPAQQEMRAAFLEAQGLPPTTPWRPDDEGGRWQDIPAEQFAEAAIAAVLGSRPIPTAVHLSPAAVQVVADWGRGGPAPIPHGD